MHSEKKASPSRHGRRLRTVLSRPPQDERCRINLHELVHTGTHSTPWMLILDLKTIIKEIEQVDQLRPLLAHLEPREIVEYLATRVDRYDIQSHKLYEVVYKNFAGIVSTFQLVELVDALDDVYRRITETIMELNKEKYGTDSYQFEKWLSPTEAVISSSTSRGLPASTGNHRYS